MLRAWAAWWQVTFGESQPDVANQQATSYPEAPLLSDLNQHKSAGHQARPIQRKSNSVTGEKPRRVIQSEPASPKSRRAR